MDACSVKRKHKYNVLTCCYAWCNIIVPFFSVTPSVPSNNTLPVKKEVTINQMDCVFNCCCQRWTKFRLLSCNSILALSQYRNN
ncbi:Guanylate cyclase [Trichinella pseudospiralis]